MTVAQCAPVTIPELKKSNPSKPGTFHNITKDDLKLPPNFKAKQNVDRNDPVELLDAMFISDSQGYDL